MISIFYLDDNPEYIKIDERTYRHYKRKTKMTVDLVFKPEGEGVDVETNVKKILLRQYIKREANIEYVPDDVLQVFLSKSTLIDKENIN